MMGSPILGSNETFGLVAAVNDDAVLGSSLAASADFATMAEIHLERGRPTAATAYNEGIAQTRSPVILFAHQDLFLPPGWMQRLERSLEWLEANDPEWGVVGLYGNTSEGGRRGWIHTTGLGRTLGASFPTPQQVRTLDEVLLVIRRASQLRFDEALPGFHMYGTDICLAAEARGLRNYVIPAFAIHNSNGIRNLPWDFWRACIHIRRKWYGRLPIFAPCVTVDYTMARAARLMFSRFLHYSVRSGVVGTRVATPAQLYVRLCQDDQRSLNPAGERT